MDNIIWKNCLNKLLNTLIIVFSIYFFLGSLSLHLDEVITGVFNSDESSIPYLYRDLIQYHHPLKYWLFSPTNYLFPDTLIYFLVAPFFDNFKLAFIASEFIILISYYLLLVLVGKTVCGSESKNLFRISALISIILINSPLRALMTPIFTGHFGSNVLVYLLELYLIIKLWQRPSKLAYCAVILIPILAIISDPLCQGPLILSTIVGIIGIYSTTEKNQRPVLLKTAILLLIGGLLGAIIPHFHLFNIFIKSYPMHFQISYHRALFLYRAFWNFTQHNPLIVLIMLLDIGICGYLFYQLVVKKVKSHFNNPQEKYTFFVLFSTASCLPILILMSIPLDIDLVRNNLSMLHFVPGILLPVFLGFPILLIKYIKSFDVCRIAEHSCVYVSLVLLGLLLLFVKHNSLQPTSNYYPVFAKCLDNYYESGQLYSKNGTAEYWDAHHYSMLTKNRINLIATNYDNSTADWMSTQEDYLDQTFTFAIIRKSFEHFTEIRKQHLTELRTPNAVLTCPGDSDHTIYVFKQGFSLKQNAVGLK